LVAQAALAAPALPQATDPQIAAQADQPIPVPADEPPGSSTPGSIAAGGAAAVVIVVLGVVLFSSLAFFPE
jgi:hypothetical protein